jgi:hypothetical protein
VYLVREVAAALQATMITALLFVSPAAIHAGLVQLDSPQAVHHVTHQKKEVFLVDLAFVEQATSMMAVMPHASNVTTSV